MFKLKSAFFKSALATGKVGAYTGAAMAGGVLLIKKMELSGFPLVADLAGVALLCTMPVVGYLGVMKAVDKTRCSTGSAALMAGATYLAVGLGALSAAESFKKSAEPKNTIHAITDGRTVEQRILAKTAHSCSHYISVSAMGSAATRA